MPRYSVYRLYPVEQWRPARTGCNQRYELVERLVTRASAKYALASPRINLPVADKALVLRSALPAFLIRAINGWTTEFPSRVRPARRITSPA